ncbi:MAG: hypothetical protein V4654_12200 [Bdellovibrionota bacterium]
MSTASIEVAEDRGGLHTLLLKLPKVPLDVTALDKILNENGYTIILDQSVLKMALSQKR